MANATELLSLHLYYLRASLMRELLLRHFGPGSTPVVGGPADLAVKIPKPLLEVINFFDAANVLSLFYGTLYVLLEGFQELGLSDPAIDALLKSENVDLLRRFRNATFHYQRDVHDSAKVLDLLAKPNSETWMNQLWSEFRRWCSQNLRSLVEEQMKSGQPWNFDGFFSWITRSA